MPLSKNDLKTYSSLHRKSKRFENGIFMAEGIKICQEAIKSNYSIERLLITEQNLSFFPEGEIISNKDAQRISNQKQHSGVIAIIKIPEIKEIKSLKQHLLIIDGINDPGNLGSIIRSMDWFGFDQLICSNSDI